MAKRESGGFGSMLRQARERRGISLRQIAGATKLSVGALEALEQNDISRLPGGIFSRAIVRAYATEVGLDPEQTTQDFVAQFPLESVTAGHPATTHAVNAEDNVAFEGQRRSVSVFIWIFLISAPVAGGLVYFSINGRPMDPSPPSRAAEASTPLEAPQPVPAFTIGVTAAAPCLVTLVADGQQVLDRQLKAGESQSFEVKRDAFLTISDPLAVTLTLNGREARVPVTPGESVVLTLTPSNYTEYLTLR